MLKILNEIILLSVFNLLQNSDTYTQMSEFVSEFMV